MGEVNNMNLIKIENCSRAQEALLRFYLSKTGIPKGKIEIYFEQKIANGKCNCLWYGGNMVTIIYKDYSFFIDVLGDVIVSLQAKDDLHEIARVKDKSNSGIFMDEMSGYIEDDIRLGLLIANKDPEYILNIDNNNWFEIGVQNNKNEEGFGYGTVLNADSVLEAVVETVSGMEGYIKAIERDTKKKGL